MQILEVEHRGLRAVVQCEDGFEQHARDKVIEKINWQLDEKPKRDKRIRDFEDLRARRDSAHKKAIENLNFVFPPLLLQLLKEYNLEDVAISNQNVSESPLNMVIPQLRALVSDIHYHRKNLDQNILQEYWDAETALEETFTNHIDKR